MRFTIVDHGGTISFIDDGFLMLPLVAACASNPRSLQEMLERSGLPVKDLRGLAVFLGPASFTGLRVGVVAAKTLGQALGLPAAISVEAPPMSQTAIRGGSVTPVASAPKSPPMKSSMLTATSSSIPTTIPRTSFRKRTLALRRLPRGC